MNMLVLVLLCLYLLIGLVLAALVLEEIDKKYGAGRAILGTEFYLAIIGWPVIVLLAIIKAYKEIKDGK